MRTEPDRLYRFAQLLARMLWRTVGRLDVEGTEHVPADGPFLLICNHQSNLDPILIHAVCPRPVHAMAKSTQFSAPLVGAIMKRLYSFPVRRYQIDPQAVRLVLRRLQHGHAVAIYIEGERTWDGRLQDPRLGTLRLALKAGVPIVPCTVSGTYEAWPRWHSHIQPRPVSVCFGPPLRLPKLDRKADRERALPATADQIMGVLSHQLAQHGNE